MGAFAQTLKNLGPARLAAIGGALVALIALFIVLATRLSAPNLGLLYANLDPKDAAQIVQKLDSMNVVYQVKGDGTTILAPSDQIPRLRLSMAELGIPKGNAVGYELFDKSDMLGATNFQQGVNEMRAMEGELARTINSISAIDSSRVHLVLPKRELFSREKQEPSASIVLRLRGSGGLAKQQIVAIQNLVASAVPNLSPNRVTIIDQNGTPLAKGDGTANGILGNASAIEEQRIAYENRIGRSIEDMLERSVGFGHVRVDVNADIDFDRVTTDSETFDPDGQVARSTQSVNENNESSESGDSPISVQNNLPDGQQAQGAGSGGGRNKKSRTEETTNFEIAKKKTTLVREGGVLRKISVAVLIDGTYATTPAGERAWQPRTPEELKSFTTLVQSAIGYNEKRGDRVEVVNMRFALPDEGPAEAPAILLGLNKADLLTIGETITIGIVSILAILLVVRPMVTRALDTARDTALASQRMLAEQAGISLPSTALAGPGGSMGALAGPAGSMAMTTMGGGGEEMESMIDISQVEGRVRASSMKKIGEIVDKHPEEAVAILRSWMYQGT